MGTNILDPKVTLNIIPGPEISTVQERSMLIIGTRTAGSANPEFVQGINSLTGAEIDAAVGAQSFIRGMIQSALDILVGITPQPQIDIISLADPAGTAAEAVITLTGPATESGSITFIVGSKNDRSYTIDIADTDSATVIGDALVAAITADTSAPFTAANVAGVVTITAVSTGLTPNTWGIGFQGEVAGVVVALTTEWSGGLGTPSLTTVFDAIADIRETTITWPEAYPEADVATFLDGRFNAANDVLDGVAISVHADTLTNLKAAALALNSQSVNIIGNTYDIAGGFLNKKGPGVFEISDNAAAEIGIIRALRLTEDAPVSQFLVTAGAPNDAFGGIHISSKPYHNTNLPNISIPQPGEYFSQVDQADLIDNGVSVFGANRANNSAILGTQVTTFLTSGGNPSTAFKLLNTVDQSSIIREFYVNNLRTRYAQSRLTDGAITVGFGIENKDSIRGFCIQLYQELAAEVITQSGNTALADYKDTLSVVTDLSAGKVTINQAPLLVGQIRIIVGAIEVNFG